MGALPNKSPKWTPIAISRGLKQDIKGVPFLPIELLWEIFENLRYAKIHGIDLDKILLPTIKSNASSFFLMKRICLFASRRKREKDEEEYYTGGRRENERRIDLFSRFALDFSYLFTLEYADKDFVFCKKGDPPASMWILQSGSVGVFLPQGEGEDSKELQVATLSVENGEKVKYFGELPLFLIFHRHHRVQPRGRSATVRALTNVKFLLLRIRGNETLSKLLTGKRYGGLCKLLFKYQVYDGPRPKERFRRERREKLFVMKKRRRRKRSDGKLDDDGVEEQEGEDFRYVSCSDDEPSLRSDISTESMSEEEDDDDEEADNSEKAEGV